MGRARTIAVSLATMLTAGIVMSQAGTPAGGSSSGQRFQFRDKTTGSAFVDQNRNGVPDPGDYFVFHEKATNRGWSGKESNDSQCVVALADEYLCHVAVVIRGSGEVIVDGSIHAPGGAFPKDFDLAVTGGSGAFDRARGSAHVHQISSTVSIDTLYLRT